jgi:hypothetical protein
MKKAHCPCARLPELETLPALALRIDEIGGAAEESEVDFTVGGHEPADVRGRGIQISGNDRSRRGDERLQHREHQSGRRQKPEQRWRQDRSFRSPLPCRCVIVSCRIPVAPTGLAGRGGPRDAGRFASATGATPRSALGSHLACHALAPLAHPSPDTRPPATTAHEQPALTHRESTGPLGGLGCDRTVSPHGGHGRRPGVVGRGMFRAGGRWLRQRSM